MTAEDFAQLAWVYGLTSPSEPDYYCTVCGMRLATERSTCECDEEMGVDRLAEEGGR